MSDNPASSTKDSLGLDLDSLKISESEPGSAAAVGDEKAPEPAEERTSTSQDAPAEPPTPSDEPKTPKREKKAPYVNLERVKTGGSQRDKLTEEELADRMARIREKNEKIKQRRVNVEQDERDFKKLEEEDRQKVARIKKVQQGVDRAREQNARRKMNKIQNREWDSGKPGMNTESRRPAEEAGESSSPMPPTGNTGFRGAVRGGRRGRGRGRGRGGPPSTRPAAAESQDASDVVPPSS